MSKQPDPTRQCQHISPRGQRCRMLRASDGEPLCPYHLRKLGASQPDPEALAADLLDSTGGLATAGEINALLGNVVKQLSHKRIDRKDAVAYGYLSQLLLGTLPGLAEEAKAVADAQHSKDLARFFKRARANFLATRAAAEAQKAARAAQRNALSGAKESSAPAPQPAAQNAPAPTEPGIPRPPREYAVVRT